MALTATSPPRGRPPRLLRAAFEQAPVGMCVMDAEGRIAEANQRFGAMLGAPLDELRGLDIADHTHPSQLEELRSVLARLGSGELRHHPADWRCRRRDGSDLWASLDLSGLREGEGRVAQVVAMSEDMTESRVRGLARRREAGRLAELVAVHERLAGATLDLPAVMQLILESVQHMTGAEAAALCEVGDDRIRWIAGSGAAAGHVGLSLGLEANLCGECVATACTVLCPDTSSDPRSDLDMYRRTGFRSLVYVPLLHRGRVVAALGAFAPSPSHFSGEDVASLQLMAGLMGSVMASAREYHQRKIAQDRLEVIIESCPVALFAYDRGGELTFMEGSGLEGLGLEPGSWLGRPIFELFASRLRLVSGIRATLSGQGFSTTFETAAPARQFEARFSPVLGLGGEVTGGAGVVTDLSDRVEAEQARQESEAKSRFLATVSHELRTPLNSVIGFSQLLAAEADRDLNQRQRRYITNIESSGQQLLTLINDLLDVGRIQAGRLDVAAESLELQDLLSEAAGQAAASAAARGLTLELRRGAPVWVRADRGRVHQVVSNLLANAIKFTGAGGLITLEALADPDMPMVVVTDTGIGIPSDQLDRVFDEFTQVESGTDRNQEGTGLGLALCRRLVQLMGGSIGIASEVGAGSVFTLSLPRSTQVA